MATLGMPLLGMGQETPTLTSLLTARREREKQSKLADLLANAYGAKDDAQRQQYMQEAIRTDPTQGMTLAKLLDPRFQDRSNLAPHVVDGALVDASGKVLYRSPEKPKTPEYDVREYGGRLYYIPKSPMFGQQPVNTPPQAAPDSTAAAPSGNTPAADAGFDILRNAVMWQESRGNPNAVSPKGAMGTMQTMPGTLRDPGFGVAPAADGSPQEMERVGTDYLRAMTEKYGPVGGLAAYNWGPGNWDRALQAAGGDPQAALAMAPRETQQYVPSVLGRVGGGGGAGMGFGVEQNAGVPAGAIPIPGLPDAPSPFRARQYTPQEIQQMGLPAGTVAYTSENGTPNIVSKPPATSGVGQVIDNGDGTTTYIPAGKVSEGERNAAGFYQRMVSANAEMQRLTDNGYDPSNRRDYYTAGGEILNPLATSEGRQFQQAKANWVRANLRKESGAAIGKSEMENEIANYFPIPGDDDATIAQKARNRRVVEQAMRTAAGAALAPMANRPAQAKAPQAGAKPAASGGQRVRKFNPATGRLE